MRGGYKVDVSRGANVDRVSSEWFSRREDERYLALDDLFASGGGAIHAHAAICACSASIRCDASQQGAMALYTTFSRIKAFAPVLHQAGIPLLIVI